MEITFNNILNVVMLISIIYLLFIVLHKISDAQQQGIEYCNEMYGEGNWYWNETTGSEKAKEQYPYYLGQVWECTPFLTIDEVIS